MKYQSPVKYVDDSEIGIRIQQTGVAIRLYRITLLLLIQTCNICYHVNISSMCLIGNRVIILIVWFITGIILVVFGTGI